MVDDLKNLLKRAEETIEVVKKKVLESTTYFALLGEVLKKVMDVAHSFGERHREAKERKAEEEYEEERDREDIADIKKGRSRKIKVK